MTCSSIIILLLIALMAIVVSLVSDYFWRKKPLKNFPFKFRGKEFWFSRSVAVTLFTFCENEKGKMCILANRRGTGTPDFQGYWNAPCGYLDFDENSFMAAQRETYEETGVYVKTESIKLLDCNSDPNDNKRQNVTLRHYAILEGHTSDYKLDTRFSEKNEVSDVKWIPLDEIYNYEWAFNHKKLIDKYVRELSINVDNN